jgi:lysozyme family protein
MSYFFAALILAVVGVALVIGGVWALCRCHAPVDFAAGVMALAIGIRFLWTLARRD